MIEFDWGCSNYAQIKSPPLQISRPKDKLLDIEARFEEPLGPNHEVIIGLKDSYVAGGKPEYKHQSWCIPSICSETLRMVSSEFCG